MAKHCETCNRDYPEHLSACPHCYPSSTADDAAVDEVFADLLRDEPAPAGQSAHHSGDSNIELGHGEPAASASDKALEAWFEDDASSATPSGQAGQADVVAAEGPSAKGPDESAPAEPAFPDMSLEKGGPPPVDEVSLGEEPLEVVAPSDVLAQEVVEAPAEGASGILEVVDVVEPGAEAGMPGPVEVAPPPAEETLDVVDVGIADLLEVGSKDVQEATAANALDISADDLVAEEEAAPADALDLGAHPGDEAPAEALAADDTSAVDLGAHVPSKSGPPSSGVDPIAEALESGADLGHEVSAPPAEEKVDISSLRVGGEPSSAVDLGATVPMSAELPSSGASGLDVTQPFEAGELDKVGSADLLAESPSAIERAAAADLLAGDERPARAAREVPEEVAEEVAQAAEEVAEPAEEAEEELVAAGPPARKDKEQPRGYRRPRYGRRWLGGTLLGILLTAGGAAAVWYFAPELLDQIPPSPNAPVKPIAHAGPKGPVATPLEQALALANKGDINEAWELVKDTGKTPEEQSARGEVRWLKYLRDQQAKKAPPQADAPEVKTALQEVMQGKNDLLARQISSVLASGQLAKLAAQEKSLRDQLAKAKTASEQEAQQLAALGKVLAEAKLIEDSTELDAKSLEPVVKDLAQSKKVVGEVEAAVGAKQDELPKKIAELVASQKALEKKVAEINTELKTADAKDVAELVVSRNRLRKEKASLNATLTQALKELGQNKVDAGDLSKQLLENVVAVREKAKAPLVNAVGQIASSLSGLSVGAGRWMQAALDRAAVESQLRYYQAREPLIQSPEQKLDTWIALYQDADRKDARQAQAAGRDAQWVQSKQAKATPEARAKSHYLEALIARNQGKYDEARKHLQEALQEAQALKSTAKAEWPGQAGRLLKELTDPAAYYLPRAEALHSEGRLKEALGVLGTGLAALPQDGRLHAQRGLVQLELAGTPAKVKESAGQIRADAEAAKEDPATAAVGYYVLGRLEEELGHFSQAEQNYRLALKHHRGSPAEANRYRIALARVLQLEASPAAEGPGGNEAGGQQSEVRAPRRLATLVVLALTGLQPPADDEESPASASRLQESIDLANDLIKSDDRRTRGQGYMLLGLAHSRQGRRTDGLHEYLKGLRLVHPDKSTRDLEKLVNEHPAFQLPDTRSRPDAAAADVHFGRGVALYWDRKYAEAEIELKRALELYAHDARYRYFLGLARLAQGSRAKREAAWFDFEQGARLEVQNRPGMTLVNSSLERVQGALREYLDGFREKATLGRR